MISFLIMSSSNSYRCGMIYMEPVQLGWKPLVTSWMEHQLPDFVTKPQRELIGVSKNRLATFLDEI